MIGYVKHFDNSKTTSFKVSDNKLLNRYNKIWGKISNLLDIKFDSQPVYGGGDKYIKKEKCMEMQWIQIFKVKKCLKEMLDINTCH